MSSMDELPPELLEEVVGHISKPNDLLSLALAAKIFCSIVIPDHLEFRHLRTNLTDTRTWNFLIHNPLQASYIHRLEIFTELPWHLQLRIPKPILARLRKSSKAGEHPTAVADSSLDLALPFMKSLVDLTLNESFSTGALDAPLRNQATLDIETRSSLQNRLLDIKELTIYNMSYKALYPGGLIHSIANQSGMALTHLCINAAPQGLLSEILEVAHWPILRKITIVIRNGELAGGAEYANDRNQRQAVLTKFLAQHPLIEAFRLSDRNFARLVTLPANTMTRLRSVDFSGLSFGDVNHWLPPDISERLWFTPFLFTGFSLKYVALLKSLRFCFLSDAGPEDLERLAEMAPQLEKLQYKPGSYGYGEQDPDIFDPVVTALSKYKKLTHLAQYCTLIHPTIIVRKRLCEIPRLAYVEMNDGWIELMRYEDGSYLSHRGVHTSRRVMPAYWGEFFDGSVNSQ